MQDELSESDVERRRQAPVADAPEANTVSPMSNPTAESGPKAQAIGNQGVRTPSPATAWARSRR